MFSPKYSWCLVIDDEALQSIEAAPEPIGPTPPEGAHPADLAYQAVDAFVKLLSASYTTMEKPKVLAAQGRRGTGRKIEWNGWLKFSPVMLMGVFSETCSGDINTHFRVTINSSSFLGYLLDYSYICKPVTYQGSTLYMYIRFCITTAKYCVNTVS